MEKKNTGRDSHTERQSARYKMRIREKDENKGYEIYMKRKEYSVNVRKIRQRKKEKVTLPLCRFCEI